MGLFVAPSAFGFPAVPVHAAPACLCMSMHAQCTHYSRRALLAGALVAAAPLSALAATELEKDEAVLKRDEVTLREEEFALRGIGSKISSQLKLERAQKAEMKKKSTEMAAAIEAGDKQKVVELSLEIDELRLKISAEDQLVADLRKEEKAEKAIELKQLAKVRAEEAKVQLERDALGGDEDLSAGQF